MSEKQVAAVVLAAGASRRMGTAKQLIEIDGQTLLRRTVETVLAALPCVSVIFGFQAQQHFESVCDLPISPLFSPRWKSGLSESVKATVDSFLGQKSLESPFQCAQALQRAAEPSLCDAILFVPCDLPLLSSAHLRNIIEIYQSSEAPLVVSQWNDVVGVPALFDRSLWPEFRFLAGDQGARKIIHNHKEKALAVAFPGGEYDLDTPQDVENFKSKSNLRKQEIEPE